MKVTAEINVESPTGRRIVHELEKHKKVVKLSYPSLEDIEGQDQTYTFNEFKANVKDEFKKRYGVDFDEI